MGTISKTEAASVSVFFIFIFAGGVYIHRIGHFGNIRILELCRILLQRDLDLDWPGCKTPWCLGMYAGWCARLGSSYIKDGAQRRNINHMLVSLSHGNYDSD